jgi:hypothetical protein
MDSNVAITLALRLGFRISRRDDFLFFGKGYSAGGIQCILNQ